MNYNDTITAVASPPGKGAIAIIRISGCGCFEITEKIFKTAAGKSVYKMKPREMVFGRFYEDSRLLDEGMCVIYKAPFSYTGEDSAELFCHGGRAVTRSVLEAALLAGARMAEGGEFTKRALLNGKLDITAAEAVGEIIDAENSIYSASAAAKLTGEFGKRLKKIRTKLIDAAAHFAACIDYADEGVEAPDDYETGKLLGEACDELHRLREGCLRGSIIREGIPAAIIGKTNSGKSTLLNKLIGYDRAIVTEYEGTTRDIIEESVKVGNIILKLSDTAGFRETEDPVEKIGIEKSVKTLKSAALVLALFDGSAAPSEEDRLACGMIEAAMKETPGLEVIKIINKIDAGTNYSYEGFLENADSVIISAMTGEGTENLIRLIENKFMPENYYGEEITNLRQQDAVLRACRILDETEKDRKDGITADVIWSGLYSAAEALGEITGDSATDDMIGSIFKNFCVGK